MRYNWNLYNEYGSTQIDEVFPNFEQFKALRVILPSECSCLNILAYQYPDRKLLGDLEEELLKIKNIFYNKEVLRKNKPVVQLCSVSIWTDRDG